MKRILITGASTGIGLALATELKSLGNEVIAVCRKPTKELKDLDVEIIDGVDVTDHKSISKLSKSVGKRKIDILINNAGIFLGEKFGEIDYENLLDQFKVNSLGPIRVTEALHKSLQKGSTVVMISSQMGSIAMNDGGYFGYRMSKAALNIATISLSKDLKEEGISFLLIHPGYVKTRMTKWKGVTDPMDSAKGIIAQINRHTLKETGEFRSFNSESLPW